MGKNTLAGYLHDCDKLFLYLTPWLKEGDVQKIHRCYQPHHAYCPKQSKVEHLIEMYIDWECAAITKPDKPLNAFATLLHFYRDDDVIAKMLPVCLVLNPQSVSPLIADLDEARKKNAKDYLFADSGANCRAYSQVRVAINNIKTELEVLTNGKRWCSVQSMLERVAFLPKPMFLPTYVFVATLGIVARNRHKVVDWYKVWDILTEKQQEFENGYCFGIAPHAQENKIDYSSDTPNPYLRDPCMALEE